MRFLPPLLVMLVALPLQADVTARELVSQLGSRSFQQREAAARKLFEMGSRALPELLANHRHQNLEIQRWVRKILDRLDSSGTVIRRYLDRQLRLVRSGPTCQAQRRALARLVDLGKPARRHLERALGPLPARFVVRFVGAPRSITVGKCVLFDAQAVNRGPGGVWLRGLDFQITERLEPFLRRHVVVRGTRRGTFNDAIGLGGGAGGTFGGRRGGRMHIHHGKGGWWPLCGYAYYAPGSTWGCSQSVSSRRPGRLTLVASLSASGEQVQLPGPGGGKLPVKLTLARISATTTLRVDVIPPVVEGARGPAADGLRLGLATTARKLTLGARVPITAVLHNVGKKRFGVWDLQGRHAAVPLWYVFLDRRRRVVRWGLVDRVSRLSFVIKEKSLYSLGHGGQRAGKFTIGAPAAEGKYRLILGLGPIATRWWLREEAWEGELISNVVDVEVVARK